MPKKKNVPVLLHYGVYAMQVDPEPVPGIQAEQREQTVRKARGELERPSVLTGGLSQVPGVIH